MADIYGQTAVGMEGPATRGEVVVPTDDYQNTTLTNTARFLYVGTGGDVNLVLTDGTELQFVGVPSGSLLPVRCVQVALTGTTASNMVALW